MNPLVAPHTLIVIRPALVEDDRGNQAFDWEHATEHESPGWAADGGDTADDNTNRDGSSVSYTLRGPFDADVRPTDRVRFMGDVFVIDGGVIRQAGPIPAVEHSMIRLVRWEG